MRIVLASFLFLPSLVSAQLGPLPPPIIPPENAQTPAKIQLGKALFWEEQLSTTGTVACGTCHRPGPGGSDPRSLATTLTSLHPGPDGTLGTPDDIVASPGVPRHAADGGYLWSNRFGLQPQVGARKAPSMINAAFAPQLLWDGRALNTFTDPLSGSVVVANGGALESQAVLPLLDDVEMSSVGASAAQLSQRLTNVTPLALAHQVPTALSSWINQRSYPALFAEVFGDGTITPARIAMAIASYERSLISNQAPVDLQDPLTQQEQRGRQLFAQLDCAGCHTGAVMTDHSFKYIGVRPVNDDLGRFTVTGQANDRGAFKVPGLRNVALRAPYMHTGRLQTLTDVVNFYARGGDFNAPNKDPRVRARNIPPQDRQALVAFLTRPLTDPRVANEEAPFDRPRLFTESDLQSAILGSGIPGSLGQIPQIQALEPGLRGRSITIAVHQARAGGQATLILHTSDPGTPGGIPSGTLARFELPLATATNGLGYGSVRVSLSGLLAQPTEIFGRFYITDPEAAGGLAVSPLVRIPLFGIDTTDPVFRSGFEAR